MPDWSYHCLFKPILFRLPARMAEDFTLKAIGTLATLPGGSAVIDALGNMKPAAELAVNSNFASLVGLSSGFNVDRHSLKALSGFGFGFIEVGPITTEPLNGAVSIKANDEIIVAADVPSNRGVDWWAAQLVPKPIDMPLSLRLAHMPGTSANVACDELKTISGKLKSAADYVVLDSRWNLLRWSQQDLISYMQCACEEFERVLLLIDPAMSADMVERLAHDAQEAGVVGFVVGGGMRKNDGTREYGGGNFNNCHGMLAQLRSLAPDAVLIAADAIMQPADAFKMFSAGANFVELYSGFVFAGPGLPKRINEAVSYARHTRRNIPPSYTAASLLKQGWLGFTLVGLGLVITSVAAITVGLTTVILPYDETFVNLTRAGFDAINPHLLHFMEHDRVTYAGTSLSTGLLFALLAIFGIRKGQHWSFLAVRNAGLFGFASFLLCLGFRYLDPLHALVTLGLLPFYIWGALAAPKFVPARSANFYNDDAWKKGLWGQFWFVSIGFGLLLAGITIARVGTSTVFVPEDLMFMHTDCAHLLANQPHLLPAIAHDRAGFGGALFTVGLAVLITGLHGFRQGQGWVWWTLLIAGLPAFVATTAIHYAIGYTNQWHLLPVYIAVAMFAAGLWMSYPYLCRARSDD